MTGDKNGVGGQVKRLRLSKFDGEATPGKQPVEIVEVEFDDHGRETSRTVTRHNGDSKHGTD